MIVTSIKYLIKNIKNYTELVKNNEIVIAEDDKCEIVLVRKDKIKEFKNNITIR